jgi:hypothetical protein
VDSDLDSQPPGHPILAPSPPAPALKSEFYPGLARRSQPALPYSLLSSGCIPVTF